MSRTSLARHALALSATAMLGCGAHRRPPPRDAVLLATVQRLEETESLSPRWIVHCRVDQVLSGELRARRFDFRVFSPALSGLEVGRQVRIDACAGRRGYLVDPVADFTPGAAHSSRCPSFAPSASSRE